MAINFTNGTVDTITEGSTEIFRMPNNYQFPNWPAFHAFRDAGHVGQSSQTVVFDGTRLNNGGHYSTSTGIFTAPISGTYWFHCWSMDNSGSTQYTNDYYEIRRNNSRSDQNSLRVYTSAAQATRSHRAGGWIRRLNGGDNVRVFNINAAMYGTSYVYLYFSGCLLAV
jgi:hypothetical protein